MLKQFSLGIYMRIENLNVFDILLYPVSVIGLTMVGPPDKFQNKGSQKTGNAIL